MRIETIIGTDNLAVQDVITEIHTGVSSGRIRPRFAQHMEPEYVNGQDTILVARGNDKQLLGILHYRDLSIGIELLLIESFEKGTGICLLEHLKEQPSRNIYARAATGVYGFYVNHGFRQVGESQVVWENEN